MSETRVLLKTETALDNHTLNFRQIVVRLAPMLVVSWTRVYAVVLPGVIGTFDLSLSQAGLFVATIEMGSILSMLVLGVLIERMGAVRVLRFSLPVIAASLLVMTLIPAFGLLLPVLLLLGSGMAWSATGVNMLMAATGERRAFYLGVLHSAFGAFSVAAPLVAGIVLAWDRWQTYYQMVALITLIMAVLVWKFERGNGPSLQTDGHLPRTGGVSSSFQAGKTVMSLIGVCLGVFALAGVQGIFATWSYLYVASMYDVGHERATWAPALLWVGILSGRIGLIGLSRRYSARTLLMASSFLPGAALIVERLCSSYWVALASLFVAGVGVSGTYQLGTAWAAERAPECVGTASTAIMTFAWLGIGVWPWVTGVVADHFSFSALIFVMLAGSAMAFMAFSVTREK